MDKLCPSCSSIFRCRVNQIELCNCTKLNLTKGVREYIKITYGNCLCFNCLKKLNDEFALLATQTTEEQNS